MGIIPCFWDVESATNFCNLDPVDQMKAREGEDLIYHLEMSSRAVV